MSNYLKACAAIERRSRRWRVSWFPPDMDWKKGLGRFVWGFSVGLTYLAAMFGLILFAASLLADTRL